MQETRQVNTRYVGIGWLSKKARELRLPKEKVESIRHPDARYVGKGWYEYTYETDIPWEYR